LERYSLLAELIRLANADKEFHEIEHQFIRIIASQLGLNDEEFNAILHSTENYPKPKPVGDRMLQFQRLWLLMNVDGAIGENEMIALKTASIQLGLNPEATNEVIRISSKYPNNLVPNELFIAIFTKHNN
jgi:uncharacterized tellurite resistance protein B-like protein